MAFNGTEGEFISIDEGGQMTAAWRNGSNGNIKGVFYGKEKLETLLNQAGVGIRMYFAKNENDEATLVMVSVDADGNDILDSGVVLERGEPCPINCSNGNPLNS